MPYKDPEKNREYQRLYRQARPDYQRKWRDERKRLGLCVQCSKLALPFDTRCVKHYDMNLRRVRKYYLNHLEEKKKCMNERRQRLKDEGRCPECGAPVYENVYCPDCIEADNSGSRRRRSFAITYV